MIEAPRRRGTVVVFPADTPQRRHRHRRRAGLRLAFMLPGPLEVTIEHRDELAALMAARPGTEVETAHERFAALVRRPAWFADAVCSGVGVEVFYVGRGRDVRPAKALCASCPVSGACRDYAAANAVEGGIWAGVTAYKIHSAGRAAA